MNVFLLKRLPPVVFVALLCACAGPKPDTASEPAPISATPITEKPPAMEKRQTPEKALSPSEATLKEGMALYNDGNFAAAIRRFNTITNADKPIQLQAYKYAAFSYCVSGKKLPCRQQFEKAVKLDPTFDLEPGEKGHPMWGSVFERVKKRKK